MALLLFVKVGTTCPILTCLILGGCAFESDMQVEALAPATESETETVIVPQVLA